MSVRLAEAALWLVGTIALLVAPAAVPDGTPIGPAQERSLLGPPQHGVGEWWDVEVEDWYTGTKDRGTFVVTHADAEQAGFGVAANSLEPLLFNNRLFPLGDVRAGSLTFAAYGQDLQLVAFPMQEGRTWTTAFGPVALDARVERATGTHAFVTFHDAHGRAWGMGNYSARLGWYEDLAIATFAKLRVLGHGHGYACATVFPADFSSPPFRTPPVAAPRGAFWHVPYVVPDGPTHAMITMLSAASAGFARQQVMAPDGAVYQTANTAGSPFQFLGAVHEDPAGPWEVSGTATVGNLQVYTQTTFRAVTDAGAGTDDCTGPMAMQASARGPARDDAGPWGLAARLLLVAAAFLARHWRTIAFASVRLFSRLDAGDLAFNAVRRGILEELRITNGLSTQDLRRRLHVGWGTVTYHLAVLERHGAVLHVRSGKRQVWATPETPADQLGRIAALGHPQARRVFEAIAGAPGRSQAEIARLVGVSPATVHHHVRRLAGAGAVTTIVQGRRTLHYAT